MGWGGGEGGVECRSTVCGTGRFAYSDTEPWKRRVLHVLSLYEHSLYERSCIHECAHACTHVYTYSRGHIH